MLRELILENFVLIKRAHIYLDDGLTVFTGETGAGKSLLVRAVKLLLGERQVPGLIYPGAERAVLQAIFDPPVWLREVMEEFGLSAEEGLIIKRIFSRKTKARTYVNGHAVTLYELKKLTGGLLSIAGQHEYQGLLKRGSYIGWLDSFAGLVDERKRLNKVYEDLKALEEEERKLYSRLGEIQARREILEAELREIEEIDPKKGEEEVILRELELLSSSSTLKELGQAAYEKLYSSRGSCEELLSEAMEAISKMSNIDSRLNEIFKRLDSALTEIREVAYEVRDYTDDLTGDPQRIDELETRLHRLRKLLLKHGPTVEDCLRKKDQIKAQLSALNSPKAFMAEIKARLEEKRKELLDAAINLSKMRKDAARQLESAVNRELEGLFIHDCLFSIRIETPDEPSYKDVGPDGMDKVFFCFRPNPGLSPRPLNEIASGGELSRVMLALRVALSGRLEGTTILFDEIDAGIGGETANFVGEKLRSLGDSMQVLCVSHFPQVASRARGHFVVKKTQDNNQTWTEIFEVRGETRVQEIARMLGGNGPEALGYARSLLDMGDNE